MVYNYSCIKVVRILNEVYYFMKIPVIVCLLLSAVSGSAQDTIKPKKLQYFGLHQVGLLAGSSMEKAGILTTNGVRFGNWYTGISTGIDWYGIRSIPLLADVHKAFGKGRHQPFVYGNAGVGFGWQTAPYVYGSMLGAPNYQTGFMGEMGGGYFISLKNRTALTLSAGYSYKETGYKLLYNNPRIPDSHVKYYYRRIAIRIGIKI